MYVQEVLSILLSEVYYENSTTLFGRSLGGGRKITEHNAKEIEEKKYFNM